MEKSFQGVYKLIINFLMVIVLVPLGIDLFEQASYRLFGDALLSIHPWLPSAVAYLPILVLLFVYLRATLEPLEKWGLKWSNKHMVPTLIIGVISAVVIYAIDSFANILPEFGVPANPSFAVAVGFILSWGILAPFVEELLFRGVIQTVFMEKIKSSWKVHPAVFIASGFEILMHFIFPLYFSPVGAVFDTFMGTIPQLIYVAIFGAIGGYIFQKTKSVTAPFLIHAIGNAGELIIYWIL